MSRRRIQPLIRGWGVLAVMAATAGLALALAGPAGGASAGTGVTERVSISSTGTQSDQISGRIGRPAVSGDGRYVAFDSLADNLVPGDTNTCSLTGVADFTQYPGQCPDIFVRDLATSTTTRVNGDSAANQSNDTSEDPAISGDSSTVAFFTLASNLGPNDTNTCAINDQASFTDHPGQCPGIYVHSG